MIAFLTATSAAVAGLVLGLGYATARALTAAGCSPLRCPCDDHVTAAEDIAVSWS